MANTKDFFLSTTQRLFSNWTALKLAVEHGMGTRENAISFCHYIMELMYMNEKLDSSDLAAELEDFMDEHFNTELQDNSTTEMAEELLKFYRYCIEGNEHIASSELEKLPPVQSWIISHVPTKRSINNTVSEAEVGNNSDSSSEEENMEVEESGEEEWTKVKGRRRR